MDFLKKLLGTKQDSTKHSINQQLSIAPPDISKREDYIRRCLEAEFTEKQETRTFRTDPALTSILTPLNSQQYSKAINAGKAILPRFPDFDLIYKWIGYAYLSTQQLSKSRDILTEGIQKANRKCLLLTDLGETEWQSGNIDKAVYWWSQALHCLSSNPIDYNAYLLLSYVAKGTGLTNFEQVLLTRVDSLKDGQVRLNATTAERLISLVEKKKTETMQKTLEELHAKFFKSDAEIDTETDKRCCPYCNAILEEETGKVRVQLDISKLNPDSQGFYCPECNHEFNESDLERLS